MALHLTRRADPARRARPMFERVRAGRYEVSIQGCGGGYYQCTPEATLPSELYTEMDVAIFSDGEWVNPLDIPAMAQFHWAQMFNAGWHTYVATYMPVEVIEEMLLDLVAI